MSAIVRAVVLCTLGLVAHGHEMGMRVRLPRTSLLRLKSEGKPSHRPTVGDGKHYALFVLDHVPYVNDTFNVKWSYEVPHESQIAGDDHEKTGADAPEHVMQWHSLDVTAMTEEEHPAPYHKSGLAVFDLKPFMKDAGVATTPRIGDSSEAGSWKSQEMRTAIAKAVASGNLKDKFGQPVTFEGCSGTDTAVMVTDATYRTTEELDFSGDRTSKIFHVGWAHIDRYEYSAAHVLEWELQWTNETNFKSEFGCDGHGGLVKGRSMCGELVSFDKIAVSQGKTPGTPITQDVRSCYDAQMHNVWLSLGTRHGLDDPMTPIKARHFAVQTPDAAFDKCNHNMSAPMMAGTCRSLLEKYGPWVKEGKWWYKPDTEFGEALAFRGQEGSPHATLSSQVDEPHRESVDMRIVCLKKRDTCPSGMRELQPSGRILPTKPTDRKSDTMCLPK